MLSKSGTKEVAEASDANKHAVLAEHLASVKTRQPMTGQQITKRLASPHNAGRDEEKS